MATFARPGHPIASSSKNDRGHQVLGGSIAGLSGERGCVHGRPGLEFLEPRCQSRTPIAKSRKVPELEPAQTGGERNVTHMGRRRDIQLTLQPVVAAEE